MSFFPPRYRRPAVLKTACLFGLICLLANRTGLTDNAPPEASAAVAPFRTAPAESYVLPIIGSAGDGQVLTTGNEHKTLHQLMDGKLVLLSFIYATCSDVNGCPFATQVLHKINRKLQGHDRLKARLRLLTLSFDPEHDTPEIMRRYGEGLNPGGLDWQFLTTQSAEQLQPILDNYQQNVQKIYDGNGRYTGTFSHLLRVYLIDGNRKIRNIYNVDSLQTDWIINDLETLNSPANETKTAATLPADGFYRAGDDKRNYQNGHYQTRSLALQQRRGQPAKLIQYTLQPPLGLPKLPPTNGNPVTKDKIALGRKLFYDRRLSFNNTFSCAICHIPEQGFSNNEMATAVGVEGRSVRRNAPSLYNVSYSLLLFHDGRENSLEQQVWGPLLAHNEMANPSIGYLVDKIKSSSDYRGLFEKIFHKPAGMETIGQALASYERTLNSANSPFDRWFYGKQASAIDADAKRGFALFTGKAGCSSCHSVGKHEALFTDQMRHNTGIGYREAMQHDPAIQTVQLAPGFSIPIEPQTIKAVSGNKENDLGYYEISQNPQDRWAYKTPSLRNIVLSAPYMHNGSLASLEDVVDFYNEGGITNENLSPLIKPLYLSKTEIAELIAFLRSLTGSNVSDLVSDGFAAPIGEMR